MTRRTFLATTAAALLAPKLTAAPSDLLAQARERIEKHRKADGTIAVRDAAGKPLAGARVQIEQLRHEFLFGANFFMFEKCREPAVEEQYRARFAELLNFATLAFYWASYEPKRGQPNYEYTDRAAAWCAKRGIVCKGHPLAWDHPASSPRWLPDDDAEIARLSHARASEIVARFKGRIDTWDVVNEATHLGTRNMEMRMAQWATRRGAVPYVSEHFRLAREANPRATLLINDYRLDPAYHALLEKLRGENGKPIFDVIGCQSHMHGQPWPLARVWETCDRYADFGVPLHFTETTLVSGGRKGPGENWLPTDPEREARQAADAANFYTMIFAHPSVEALTWWDLSDRGAWQGAAAGWLRKDMSPKPVFERLRGLIKGDWWTRLDLRTDAEGVVKTRAFAGTQRLTATLPDGRAITKDVAWKRGADNRFDLAAA